MVGGSTVPNSKPSSHNPTASSSATSVSHRKSRWEPPSTTTTTAAGGPKLPKSNVKSSPRSGPSTRSPAQPRKSGPTPNPTAGTGPIPTLAPPQPPPPSPSYGFHMLERRTIVLADGSVRSYFALPPDYHDFPPQRLVGPGPMPPVGPVSPGGPSRHQDYWKSLGLDGSAKRKFSEEEEKHLRRDGRVGFADQSHQGGEEPRASKYTRMDNGVDNSNNDKNLGFRQGTSVLVAGHKYLDVDKIELKKAFLRFAKILNETAKERKSYLDHGRLPCVACGRSTKDFPDTHSLVMHCYNFDKAELCLDHLGLHKALCVLMGWNYSRPPDNSKAYQFLSADEAAANQDDLLLWPPTVIVHNTLTGKNKFGRMEGLGNKLVDAKIRDLGFHGGKSKSMYGREGHLGVTLVKFSPDQAGLKEAVRLADYFEKDNCGRRAWTRLQPLTLGTKDDENNPHLMKFDERTREKKRVFYGYLGTATDLDKIDFDTKKKAVIESYSEYISSE